MEFVCNVDPKEYEEFVLNHPTKSHFAQSYSFGQIQKIKNFKPHYLGLKKNGIMIAAALLLERKVFKNFHYYYCPRGFVIDYQNKEYVDAFVKCLKNYVHKNKGLFLRIDPDIPLHITDNEGNERANPELGQNIIKHLEQLGFVHKGFNKNFEHNQPRYTFRLRLEDDYEKIYSNYHRTTRNILNKGNQFGLNVYKGTEEDLDEFYVTMKETAIREHLLPSDLEYYRVFFNNFKKDNESDLYMVKVNCEDLKKIYQTKKDEALKDYEQQKNNPNKNADKWKQRELEFQEQIRKLDLMLEQIKVIPEKELTLSSIITTKYKDKIWAVHGGNHRLLRELNANYFLFETMIKDAKEEGYKIIDFFGTTGDPTPDNPVYGIHLFKKRFGADLYEFIGEFDYVNQPFLNFIYQKLFPALKRVKQKIKVKKKQLD